MSENAAAVEAAEQVLARLEEALKAFPSSGDGEVRLPEPLVQKLMALAVRSYVSACRGAGDEGKLLPVSREAGITATDVAVTADGLLEAVDMDVFELQMWRSMGRR